MATSETVEPSCVLMGVRELNFCQKITNLRKTVKGQELNKGVAKFTKTKVLFQTHLRTIPVAPSLYLDLTEFILADFLSLEPSEISKLKTRGTEAIPR